MIKFFRRIRQQLLTENKFSKYLLYAIGEIVLVVIGILIALQINNWNELKKNNATTKLIFEEILNDLEYDIRLADQQISYYYRTDSLCGRVLSNEVSIKDYDSGKYLNLINPIQKFFYDDLRLNAFNLLMQKSEIIPVQYKGELNLIKDIYTNDIEDIINYNNQLEKYCIDLENEYRKNYDWYSDSKEEYLAQKKYFQLNDPKYLNNVKLFELSVEYLNVSYNVFRTNAIIAYHQIHKKNNSLRKIPEYIPKYAKASHEELVEYIGSYRIGNNIGKLSIESFYLKMQVGEFYNVNIYKIAKDTFVPGFGKKESIQFKRDSTGTVVSLDLFENGVFLYNCEKIKN
jgi:hypothetical protein